MTREVLILRKRRTTHQHVRDTFSRFSTESTKGVMRVIGIILLLLLLLLLLFSILAEPTISVF